MKKLYTFLLFFLIVCNLFATDRYVTGTGFGGTFTSISAAIAASSNWDRILVYPKAGGASYNENLIVPLSNLQLMSAVEGQRFVVDGIIVLGPGGVLVGAELPGNFTNIIDDGGMNSNVHIVNCKVSGTNGGIYANSSDTKTWVDNDSVTNGLIQIYNGRVSGCNTQNTIQLLSGAPASNDTVFLVGNKSMGISCSSTTLFIYVSNNYIYASGSFIGQPSTGINIAAAKIDSYISNHVLNNTVNKMNAPGGLIAFRFNQAAGALLEIHNNISTSTSFNAANGYLGNNQYGMNFTYNYDHNSTAPFSNMPSDPTNISSSTTTVDLNTGALNSGSDAINGGDPGTAYLDLDLTRNDAGCYGGSYSRENFTQAETGSRVLFMKATREVLQGQPVNVSGEGVDK
ncbi:MAG: hypothetical protein NTZ16_16255 [Verrucomicrobia bacterium]|nr:hypothetical protein [Verrucomicrobiota bacterium]